MDLVSDEWLAEAEQTLREYPEGQALLDHDSVAALVYEVQTVRAMLVIRRPEPLDTPQARVQTKHK
jgi:hypothetical protein